MHEVIWDEQADPTEAVFCLLSLSTVFVYCLWSTVYLFVCAA